MVSHAKVNGEAVHIPQLPPIPFGFVPSTTSQLPLPNTDAHMFTGDDIEMIHTMVYPSDAPGVNSTPQLGLPILGCRIARGSTQSEATELNTGNLYMSSCLDNISEELDILLKEAPGEVGLACSGGTCSEGGLLKDRPGSWGPMARTASGLFSPTIFTMPNTHDY